MSIAANLKHLIEVNGDNPDSCAAGTGLDPSTIWRTLRGGNENPNLATLKAISRYFHVPIAMLVGDVDLAEYERSIYMRGVLDGREQAITALENFTVDFKRTID